MYGAPFHPAHVIASAEETATMHSVSLEVAAEVAASHQRVGQFVEVRLPGEGAGAYFAIANAPNGRAFELLVKRGQGLPDELIALEAGAPVETTAAMGKGFPVEASRGHDVLLFATGSGFAPIRAVLQAIAGDRDAYGSVDLFFGVRSLGEFPYSAELERLPESGIRVHRVVSQPTTRDKTHARYVQELLLRELPPLVDAVAFLCGLEGMIEGVSRVLREAGLPPERIHLNL